MRHLLSILKFFFLCYAVDVYFDNVTRNKDGNSYNLVSHVSADSYSSCCRSLQGVKDLSARPQINSQFTSTLYPYSSIDWFFFFFFQHIYYIYTGMSNLAKLV